MKDKSVVDLNECISANNNVITITEDIEEITLTSNGEKINAAILLKPRKNDLTINIENLWIESNEDIGLDVRAGNYNLYENHIVYTGDNKIISNKNIGICISNNQTVNLIGKDNGRLEVIGGSGTCAIGNNKYTSGNGKLRFFGNGKVHALGGDGKDDICFSNKGGEGICFYNENEKEASEVLIYESAEVNLKGGNGGDISSINTNCKAGNGGSGIEILEKGLIDKVGHGKLEITGGSGGKGTGNCKTGVCGNGASAISLGFGKVTLKTDTTVNAGDGGSVDVKYNTCMVKGGDGGDCINIYKDVDAYISLIEVYDNIKLNAGNGGTSGTSIKGVCEIDSGGDGGNIINCNSNKCDITIGDVDISYGKGGGLNKLSNISNGKDGERIKGENIVSFKALASFIYDENINDLGTEEKEEIIKENKENIENTNLNKCDVHYDIIKDKTHIYNNLLKVKEDNNKNGIIFLIIDFIKKIFS